MKWQRGIRRIEITMDVIDGYFDPGPIWFPNDLIKQSVKRAKDKYGLSEERIRQIVMKTVQLVYGYGWRRCNFKGIFESPHVILYLLAKLKEKEWRYVERVGFRQ